MRSASQLILSWKILNPVHRVGSPEERIVTGHGELQQKFELQALEVGILVGFRAD